MKKIGFFLIWAVFSFTLQAKTIEEWTESADSKFQVNDYQGAISDYSKAIALSPKMVDLYVERAGVYQASNNFEKAIADWDIVISMKPDADYYRIRMGLKQKMGDTKGAAADKAAIVQFYQPELDTLTKLIAQEPDNPYHLIERGEIFIKAGEPKNAIKDWLIAANNPQNDTRWNLYYKVANSYAWDLELDQEAVKYFSIVINNSNEENNQFLTDSYFERSSVYERMGLFKEACNDYLKAIILQPDESEQGEMPKGCKKP